MQLKIAIGLAFAAAILFAAWSQQRRLIYIPDPTRVSPGDIGLEGVREIMLETPDQARLIAWYAPARAGRPTLLYFHGNAGNLAGRAIRFARYQSTGMGLLMLSYRSYSGSTGRPTEANNVADARLAYRWLRDADVQPADIILYGESLGSGVAVQLAVHHVVGGVILDAPYTSIGDVGARIYPFLPVQTLLLDHYDSRSRIASIDAPLLIVHGELDRTIPIEMGAELFERALEPKQFARIAGAGHNDHHLAGSYEVIDRWIETVWRRHRNRSSDD